jgi:hypothetical protein
VHFTETANLNHTVFPMLWAGESAELDEENEKMFKEMLIATENIVEGISFGLGIALGVLIFIAGIGCCYKG